MFKKLVLVISFFSLNLCIQEPEKKFDKGAIHADLLSALKNLEDRKSRENLAKFYKDYVKYSSDLQKRKYASAIYLASPDKFLSELQSNESLKTFLFDNLTSQNFKNLNDYILEKLSSGEVTKDLYDLVKLLSNIKKLDVKLKNKDGATALVLLSRVANKDIPASLITSIGEVLIKDGANVDEKYHGIPILIYTIRNGNNGLAQLLIDNHADVNAASDESYVPLVWASKLGQIGLVRSLIKAGADVNSQNSITTPLIGASVSGSKDMVDFLIKSGASVDEKASDGGTALMWASSYGRTNIVKTLLDSHATVDEVDKEGTTALMFAVAGSGLAVSSSGSDEIGTVRLLIKNGANINAKDDDGWTTLMRATNKNKKDIVQELLKYKNIEKDVKNKDGDTALTLAKKKGYKEIVEMLKKAGAK